MSIETFEGGGMVITGEHMELYRLLALKGALKLEARGLKLSRRTSASTVAKKQYGLKGNRDKLIAQVEQLIANFKAEKTA